MTTQNALDFELFKSHYNRLVKQGIVQEISDKELFLTYIQAEMDYPNLKAHWENQKVFRYP